MPSYFAGIDGGATQTRIVIVDSTGAVLAWSTVGPTHCTVVSSETLACRLHQGLHDACGKANIAIAQLTAVGAGLAGAADQSTCLQIRQLLVDAGVADSAIIEVDHDLCIALMGGLADAPGVVLIAGTGSSCYGRGADGAGWRAGGWGHWVDDVGSGFWLVIQAVRAMIEQHDGRGPATTLTPHILQTMKLASPREVVRRLHGDAAHGLAPMTKAQVAALAPIIFEQAQQGDESANQIIEHGAQELARLVRAVMTRLDWLDAPCPVTAAGGVAVQPLMDQAIGAQLKQTAPLAQWVEPRFPPAIGAVLLAAQSAGITFDQTRLNELSLHSASFFR